MKQWFRSLFGVAKEHKQSSVGSLIAATLVGRPVWPNRDYALLAQEGYRQNPIVYACIRTIALAFASAQLCVYEKTRKGMTERPDNPVLALLDAPNPMQDGAEFLAAWVSSLLISGNVYVERVDGLGSKLVELHVLRSDRMRIIPAENGWPSGYEYSVGGRKKTFPTDIVKNRSPILHTRTFHPLDDWYGMPALDPAGYAVDVHTGATAWNKSLLDNAARPPGVLKYDSSDGNKLTEDQFERLKQDISERFSGARNAGRPLLLEGGLTWEAIALSPSEMDFINGKADAARDIARVFGVPPMMLGIPGDNTYSNYAEANRAFWRQTVLPLLDRFCTAFTHWLIVRDAPRQFLCVDKDEVDALAIERAEKWTQIQSADFLTINEKREALGYERVDNGDVILTPSSMIPLESAITPIAGGAEPSAEMDPLALPDPTPAPLNEVQA